MRYLSTVLVATGAVAVVGCIASQQLDPGDLGRWAALHQDVSAIGPCQAPVVGGRRLPKRWTFRQNPSVMRSAISIVQAKQRLEEEAEEIEVVISPDHATDLANLLARGRSAMEAMREVCGSDKPVDRRRWAGGMAKALAGLELVVRATSVDAPAGPADRDVPLGMSAGPILDLVVQYLNQRAGGVLLADLPPEDLHQLRAVVVESMLRVGMGAAQRKPPKGLRESLLGVMEQAEDAEALQRRLEPILVDALEQAGPSSGDGGVGGSVRTVLAYAPKLLQVFEMLARQWDRAEYAAFEFHTCKGQPVVVAVLAVQPGKEIRLEDMVMFQPVLAFRGTSRMVVEPKLPSTGETVLAFESEGEGGGVEMRFEGIGWGLAKLFALPLDDGYLREVRVFVGEPGEADRIINVALLMEATNAKADPRRLLHFQDVRRARIERGPFEIRTVADRSEMVFNYLTPEKRYTFTRVKEPEAE